MREGQKYIELTLVIEDEDGRFASYCRELGTASCGNTVDEALHNIREAVQVHLNALDEVGERDRFLKTRGIRTKTWRQPKRPRTPEIKIPIGSLATRERIPVSA